MIRGFLALYGLGYARTLVRILQDNHYRALPYLNRFWRAQNFADVEFTHNFADTEATRMLRLGVSLGILTEYIAGILLIVLWATAHLTAGDLFGLALILLAPVAWAHVLAVVAGLRSIAGLLSHPKKLGRSIVCRILEHQVRTLLRKNPNLKIVAVAGSVGKTSTKLAIAKVLESQFKVRYQTGNYNDRVTVPLIFFGRKQPNIFNLLAWIKIFVANEHTLRRRYPYEVVVVELGTDGPGFMSEFHYLPVSLAVVTGITPEHMENFKTLDAVAAEELTVFDYSETVLINGDDVPGKYVAGRRFKEYSLESVQADYRAEVLKADLKGQKLHVRFANGRTINIESSYVGKPGARFMLAAAAVADQLDMEASEIVKAVKKVEPFAGRMQILKGAKDSVLIDDTYNSSPVAAKSALDVLCAAKTRQRIAILGSMNELGDYSPEAHREVGDYCDPKKLKLVVTVGADAKKYLASAAKKHGCTVKSFMSPYDAGNYVRKQLKSKAVVLAKGSQNGVFAEETLKMLLADSDDVHKLVRQSKYWMSKKAKQFGKPFGFLPKVS